MDTKDTVTITTTVHGHTEKKIFEYSGPLDFFLPQLAERWEHANATVQSILQRACRGQLMIQFAWSMQDKVGMEITGLMPLGKHELLTLAKDPLAEVPIIRRPGLDTLFALYAKTCPNGVPTATVKDLVVTADSVLLMEDEYPELKQPPAHTDQATTPTSNRSKNPLSIRAADDISLEATEGARVRPYKLDALARRRREPVEDLLWRASEGDLLLWFRLESETGCAKSGVYTDDDGPPTPDFLDKDRFWYRGWARLLPEDMGPLLIDNRAIVNRVVTPAGRLFNLMQPNIYLDGDPAITDWTHHILPSKPIEVGVDDLFFLEQEVERINAERQVLMITLMEPPGDRLNRATPQ